MKPSANLRESRIGSAMLLMIRIQNAKKVTNLMKKILARPVWKSTILKANGTHMQDLIVSDTTVFSTTSTEPLMSNFVNLQTKMRTRRMKDRPCRTSTKN